MTDSTKVGAQAMEAIEDGIAEQEPTDYGQVCIALDQVSQTIDVLASVVDRLKGQLKVLEKRQARPIEDLVRSRADSFVCH